MNAAEEKKIPDKEQVRKLLREAFPSVGERKDLTPLTHDQCIHMRSRLAMVTDENLPVYVLQILEDLLDTHTGRLGDSEDAETVVQHLNVLVQGTDLEIIKEMYGEKGLAKTLEVEEDLRQSKIKVYASFTKEQANAICRWLEHVRAWPELKWYVGEIDAALAYWQTQ